MAWLSGGGEADIQGSAGSRALVERQWAGRMQTTASRAEATIPGSSDPRKIRSMGAGVRMCSCDQRRRHPPSCQRQGPHPPAAARPAPLRQPRRGWRASANADDQAAGGQHGGHHGPRVAAPAVIGGCRQLRFASRRPEAANDAGGIALLAAAPWHTALAGLLPLQPWLRRRHPRQQHPRATITSTDQPV